MSLQSSTTIGLRGNHAFNNNNMTLSSNNVGIGENKSNMSLSPVRPMPNGYAKQVSRIRQA